MISFLFLIRVMASYTTGSCTRLGTNDHHDSHVAVSRMRHRWWQQRTTSDGGKWYFVVRPPPVTNRS
jgi:hypothetical protein